MVTSAREDSPTRDPHTEACTAVALRAARTARSFTSPSLV